MQRANSKRIVVAILLCVQQVFLFNSPLLGAIPVRATEFRPLPRAWLPFTRPSLPPARPSLAGPLLGPPPSPAASASSSASAAVSESGSVSTAEAS